MNSKIRLPHSTLELRQMSKCFLPQTPCFYAPGYHLCVPIVEEALSFVPWQAVSWEPWLAAGRLLDLSTSPLWAAFKSCFLYNET